MRSNGMTPSVIRASRANMFLSPVFTEAFVNATNIPVELYDCDGSVGAAIGAGIGVGYFKNTAEAFKNQQVLQVIQPTQTALYNDLYQDWKALLMQRLQTEAEK